MDAKKVCNTTDPKNYCRICVIEVNDPMDEYYPLHEALKENVTISLQIVLEKLFPAVFNEAQVQHDYSRNWPKAVCRKCKLKVQDAYELYESCLDSCNKLQKKVFCKENFMEEVAILNSVVCDVDVPTEVFVKCELVSESVEDPPELLIVSRRSGKTHKTEVKETARPKQTSANIKEEMNELTSEEMGDENDAEYLEENNSEQEWEPPTRKSRKPKATKQKVATVSRERKRREKKTKAKQQDKEQEEPLESSTEIFRCQLCNGPTYASPNELTDHLKAEHSGQIRSCDKCPKVFVSEQTFQHHQYCHATGRSFFCTFCDKGFQTELLLKSHVLFHTQDTKFLCAICGKRFANKGTLQMHMQLHDDKKSHPCSLCPSRFKTKTNLSVHMRTHTNNKIYTCATCGSQFNKHYSMVKHQIIHTGERPFVCDVCPMRFVSPYHVKRHMLTHTGEKPYKCSYCDRSFAQSNVLVMHMRTHYGTNTYQCDRCDASFRLLKDLRNHYKEHYNESEKGIGPSPVVDDKDIRFRSTDILKLRYRKEMSKTLSLKREADEDPDANCYFVSPYHLKRHMLTHTGEKPYKCTYCDRSFAQSNVLVKHMRTHIGDNPYQCDRCDASFRLLKDLRNHFKEHYVESEKGIGPSPVINDKDIRFTSTDILKLRYRKEMSQLSLKGELFRVISSYTMDIGNSTDSKILLDCCRICVSNCDALNCIHEGTDHVSSLSLHCMLVKLFPAVFNQEQMQHDRSINWPTAICKDCKCKVINAYDLYEQCERSSYLLNQQQLTVISGGLANEEYLNKPSDGVPLVTEEVCNLQLVKHDHDMICPSTISGNNNCNAYDVLHGKCVTDIDMSAQQQLKTGGVGIRHCEHCPKVFVTQTSFEQHQYCHATGRSYFCTFCDKGFQTEKLQFNNKSNLRQHIIGHSGDKPWACNLCPCRFSTKVRGLLDCSTMDVEEVWHSTDLLSCCRICVEQVDDYFSLHEAVDENATTSLQIVLEKLFPAVFNEAQVQHDYSMNWPTTICRDCKQKVQDAYELYKSCLDSCNKLQKNDFGKEKFDEEVSILHPVVCDVGVPTDEFVECELVLESAEVPQESLTASRRSVKTRKTTVKETLATSTKQVSITIKHENKEDVPIKKELMDENDAEYLEEKNPEPDWESPKRKRKNVTSVKVKTLVVATRERKKREQKVETNQNDSAEEVLLESKIEVHPCQLCDGLTFASPIDLSDHLKAEHSSQIRSCDKCPKVFVSEQTFQHHQYCHATGRSFFCTFCDKGFQTELLLKNHLKSHTRDPKFLCSICGKGFASKSSLQKHIIFHTDSKSWPCSLCPCRFNTKACLNVHMRTHTNNKIYTCATCGSQFNKHYSMVKHQIIHTGERPFVCDLCPMRFVSQYHVKRHMLTHTGEKPYKCTYCDRSFAQSNVLVKHMRTHIGDNPYQCDRCDASFRLLKDLRNHFKEHYVESEKGIGPSPVVDDKDIRFTSTEILRLRFQKEMGQRDS
ncbi:zinc finger protein 845-like [Anopheles marshallii]|uniref:zinc finger protein 845-like n=1 Tax=Anopheles marshallii TaxID=1521116 RepID=UPI00237A99E6|nr:zinc finger protein 845-like [Anopheles marshallii]